MPQIQRIQKRDKPVVQVKKLIAQQLRGVAGSVPGVSGGSLITPGGGASDGGGGTADATSRVMIVALNVSGSPGTPSPVNRAQAQPQGSIYGYDDSTNDNVKLRYSPLMDPANHQLF